MSSEDALLSELCTICHIQPPKYRCPRCSTRTCSLPCSRRHKLWSECSGVRDPGAYMRRNELATPAAFDRDFNFITGIERRIERAERDAENRGVQMRNGVVDRAAVGLEEEDGGEGESHGHNDGRKRKRGEGGGGPMARGEAGFLRGAQNARVKVVRAPKGMSRSKNNGSKWHPKYKCLNWMVEWIMPDGEKRSRHSLESSVVFEAYDRVYPPPKQDRAQKKKDAQENAPEQQEQTPEEQNPEQPQGLPEPTEQAPSDEPSQAVPQSQAQAQPAEAPDQKLEITPHRDVYFYLHRPRTTTKQSVLIPISPATTFTRALQDRTVLEFPTLYVLHESPGTLQSETENPKYILEEDYLRTQPDEPEVEAVPTETVDQILPGSKDISEIDENKVLEVLKQDLLEPV